MGMSSPLFRSVACVATFFAIVMAEAQSLQLQDILNGSKYPQTLSLAGITGDYKVVKLTVEGTSGSGLSDLMGLLGPLSMGASQQRSAPPGTDLFSLLGTYWTTGQTTTLGGHEFLISYRLDMGMNMKQMSSNPMGVSLKLNLVRTDMITSIQPEPDITVDRLKKDLSDAKVSFNDPDSVTMSGDSSVTAAILVPVLAQARQAAQMTSSLSNAKQAALAMLMYTNDYDDVLPYPQSTGAVIKVTEPYSKNSSIWWTGDGRRFLFNRALGGVSDVAIERPAETIMLYAEQPATDGKREVAFVDGHAKRVDSDEWKRIEPTLHLKIQRTAKVPLPLKYGEEYNASKPPAH